MSRWSKIWRARRAACSLFATCPGSLAVSNFIEIRASTTASASQIRQPIYNSSVDKWKHYAEQLMPLSRLLEEGGVAADETPDFGACLIVNHKYLHVGDA